jgi:hypothetical protein
MSKPISSTCPISWGQIEDLAINNLDVPLDFLFKQAKLSPRDYPKQYARIKKKLIVAKERNNVRRGIHVFKPE